jgi:hypothetical protein
VTSLREPIAYKIDLPSRAKIGLNVITPGSNDSHFLSETETSYIPVFSPLNSKLSRYRLVESASETTPQWSANFSGFELSKFHFQTVGEAIFHQQEESYRMVMTMAAKIKELEAQIKEQKP